MFNIILKHDSSNVIKVLSYRYNCDAIANIDCDIAPANDFYYFSDFPNGTYCITVRFYPLITPSLKQF